MEREKHLLSQNIAERNNWLTYREVKYNFLVVCFYSNFVPRPSHYPVYDCLHYAKKEREVHSEENLALFPGLLRDKMDQTFPLCFCMLQKMGSEKAREKD